MVTRLTPFRISLIYAFTICALNFLIEFTVRGRWSSADTPTSTEVIIDLFIIGITTLLIYYLSNRLRGELSKRKAQSSRINEEYTRFFNLSADAFGIIADGYFKKINPAFEHIFGYKAEDISSTHVMDLIHEEDKEIARTAFRNLSAGEPSTQVEVRIKCADGGTKWVIWTITFLAHENLVFALAKDNTFKRQAEDRIRQSEERLRAATEGSIDSFFTLEAIEGIHGNTLDFVFVDANRNAARFFKNDQLIGKKLSGITPACLAEEFTKIYVRAFSQKQYVEEEFRIGDDETDGQWIHHQLIPLENGLAVTLRDITARKRSEMAVRETSEKYQMLFESNPLPMWVYDIQTTKFLAVNEAAINHYGYSWEEFMHLTIKDIRPDEDVQELLAASSELGGAYSGTWKHLRKDKSIIFAEISSHPIMFEGKKARLILANDITRRKETENALKQSEANITALIENSQEEIWSIDLDGKLTFWNTSFKNLMQQYYDLNPQKGMAVFEQFPAPLSEMWADGFKRALQGEHFFTENQYIHKGRLFEFEVAVNPIIRENGEITGVSYFSRDITKRKEAEKAIRESEKKYRNLIENMIEGVIYINDKGIIEYANEQLLTTFCYNERDVIGKKYTTLFGEEIMADLLKDRELNDHSRQLEMKLRTKGGSTLWTLANSSPQLDSDGHMLGLLCTMTDITERKLNEEKIRKSDERYRTLIEAMHEGVLYVNNADVIQFANNRLCDMLGYTAIELIGKVSTDLIYMAEDKAILQEQRRLREKGISAQYEIRLKQKNGESIWTIINGNPLKNERNEVIGSMSTFIDISELKNTEERLKSINQDLNTFVYKSSHDLKGPLASIMGLTDLAQKEVSDPGALAYIGMIRQGANRLDRILSDLLDTVKIKEGTITINEISFETLLNDVLHSLDHSPGYERVKFDIDIAVQNKFYSDKEILYSVIQNLVDNAIKYQDYTKSQTLISVHVKDAPGGVRFELRDNGQGIPAELQNKIFNMFFRANLNSKGTGLGLYIVKNAVLKLGGNINVESVEGAGSTFRIFLPNNVLFASK